MRFVAGLALHAYRVVRRSGVFGRRGPEVSHECLFRAPSNQRPATLDFIVSTKSVVRVAVFGAANDEDCTCK